MIKRIFWTFLSFAFPWFVLLVHDNPGGAIIALVMQASVLGWIPVSIWAWRTAKQANRIKEIKK